MLKKITIKNFKKLKVAEIDLEPTVVFVGPNNSGKTTALQAIALWELGMRKWAVKRQQSKAKQRVGVTINRRDILAIPVPSALQLWYDLSVKRGVKEKNGSRGTKNIVMEITANGYTNGKEWSLGFEFDYANPESLYCRIIREKKSGHSTPFPQEALQEKVGFLPPMSGLISIEDKLEPGSINVRIGEGRTAEVLRNLCWIVYKDKPEKWGALVKLMKDMFETEVDDPQFDVVTGRITMTYREGKKKNMDLINSGRGFHQILLLLAFIFSGENKVLLIDEPDAHLEIIRQREIYNMLSSLAKQQGVQLVVATHSEVVLNEAAQKDKVIAFLGKPHPMKNKSQLSKSLSIIGFDQYLLAEQKKWILYLEGTTDLSMLRAFAEVLQHKAKDCLKEPFVKYVANDPDEARKHFYGLREAVPDLVGIAIFDRIYNLLGNPQLNEIMWQRREIENYLPIPEVIERYVELSSAPLFKKQNLLVMKEIIGDYVPRKAQRNKTDSWWVDTKMSDEFLERIFRDFSNRSQGSILIDKGRYYELAALAKPDEIQNEVSEKLDLIYKAAFQAENLINHS